MLANRGSDVQIKENTMQLGMIGLGRMGANMARRLLNGGHLPGRQVGNAVEHNR
jgi:pyrroline-5-carboxylate reductase